MNSDAITRTGQLALRTMPSAIVFEYPRTIQNDYRKCGRSAAAFSVAARD